MTSIMQRPRSTQSGNEMGSTSQRSTDDTLHRNVPRISASSTTPTISNNNNNNNNNISNNTASNEISGRALSPPPSLAGTFVGGNGLGVGAGIGGVELGNSSLQEFFLDPSNSGNHVSSSSLHNVLTPGAPQDGSLNASSSSSSNAYNGLSFGRGIFEDPAILALATQPFDPRIDFSLDLSGNQNQQHHHLQQQQHGDVMSGNVGFDFSSSSSSSNPASAVRQTMNNTSTNDTINSNLIISEDANKSIKYAVNPSSSSSSSTDFMASNVLTSSNASSKQNIPPSLNIDSSSAIAGTTAISDIDFSSMGLLQFPELPASLLDQAPEYEYSIHTQANVFDAVQDYSGAGDEEAARIFGLDNYDPGLGMSGSVADGLSNTNGLNGNPDDLWRYQDTTSGLMDPHSSSSFGAPNLSSSEGFTSFQDAQSVLSSSEYPFEPSTAPTSQGSDWKIDPSVMHSTLGLNAGQMPFPKRRRGSFDGRMESSFLSNADQQRTTTNNQKVNSNFENRPLSREPVVPSQNAGNPRTRMASWAGESNRMANDGWTSTNGQELGGNNAYGNALLQFGQAQRLSEGGSGKSASTAAANATANAARNEMINAIGNVMDAKMDSDGVAKCPYPNCTKTFAKNRSYNLKAHLRSHSQLKPFSCTHCPRAFSRKHDLERHSRVHSGDKPYLCEACGKGFPRSDALRRHWRVEKECGDKAVEIEAKQPLPSLPPGVNTPAAQAKGPIPGLMQFAAPTTTAMAGMAMQIPTAGNPGMMAPNQTNHQFVPFHAPYPGTSIVGQGSMMPQMTWDPSMQAQHGIPPPPYGAYPGLDRKRQRDE